MTHMIKLHTIELNGKKIAYSSETDFLVQVGKGRGAYKTKYSFKGTLPQALFYYSGINVGNGYKKRLFIPSFNKPTLAKVLS